MADRVSAEGFTSSDWRRLRELRERFLAFEERARDVSAPAYWRTRRDLELYDASLGERIAWKWRAVLDELALRGRLPRGGQVVDWGCGTGIAAREYARSMAPGAAWSLRVWDRSREASEFACQRLQREHPRLDVAIEPPGAKGWPDVLLVSHVLDELSHGELADLLALARRSRAVIWVEAGSRATSRRLSQVRDDLQTELDVLAPCTHQARCGVLAAGRETSWCHHFARPPAEVFTSAFWREFSSELGLDLRSVPFSFVALARRGEASNADGARARILGSARVLKGRALLEVCDEAGVREVALLQRTDRELYKRLERRQHQPLLAELELDDQRVIRVRELPSAPPASPA